MTKWVYTVNENTSKNMRDLMIKRLMRCLRSVTKKMHGRTKADCAGRNKDGAKNKYAPYFVFAFIEEMDKAGKRKNMP